MIIMLNTNQFHLNLRYKIFSSTCDHLDFPLKFDEKNIGNIIELKSQWTGEVSEWEVHGFRKRNDVPYSIELHPTKSSLKKFPKLDEYKMIVYSKGVKL